MEPDLLEVTPLRRVPTQERGRRRVREILDATEALFEELGADAITTNHIADRANTDIRGVYYFFEDKFQIFAAIVGRALAELEVELEDCASWQARDAEEWIGRLVDTHWRFVCERSQAVQVLTPLRGRPEMEAQLQRYDARVESVFVEGLRAHCPDLPAAFRRTAAHVLNVTLGELLGEAMVREGREQNAILRETRVLLRSYVCADRTRL